MDPQAAQTAARYRLVDTLDMWAFMIFLALVLAVGLFVLWDRGRHKWARTAVAAVCWAGVAGAICYLWWRVFLAWKGIYH